MSLQDDWYFQRVPFRKRKGRAQKQSLIIKGGFEDEIKGIVATKMYPV